MKYQMQKFYGKIMLNKYINKTNNKVVLNVQSYFYGVINMSKINCSVCSCKFNAPEKNKCTLTAIQVAPCGNCTNGSPEGETCCGSYIKQA